VSRESARYKLELVDVQEFRWEKWGTVRAGVYIFYEQETKIINWEQDFFLYIPHNIVSAV